MTSPAAVLFDMDGTLVDTEVLWWTTTEETAAHYGHQLTDTDAPHVVGRAVADTAAYLATLTGAPATPIATRLADSFYHRVEAGAPLRPGAAALLTELDTAGIPYALVSASQRDVVDSVVAGSLTHATFAFTLSADDTTRTKPHPDPYLTAASRLGAHPTHCIAIEDSPDGTTSAHTAGCPVLVVPSLLPVPTGPGRYFADTLEHVNLTVLRHYVTQHTTQNNEPTQD